MSRPFLATLGALIVCPLVAESIWPTPEHTALTVAQFCVVGGAFLYLFIEDYCS